MAEFYAELTQKGKELTIVSNDIPNQFSSDIPIKINKDSVYAAWLLIPYVVQSTRPTLNFEVATQGIPLKYEASTGKVVLPEQSFYIGGFTLLAVHWSILIPKRLFIQTQSCSKFKEH